MIINIQAAWVGFLLGCVSGAIPGLLFHDSNWMGGYGSWERRMIRLAHIAFFGIGFINVAFGLTAIVLELDTGIRSISVFLIVGAVTMPTVCYLSAWKPTFRHLFFIPATSVIMGIILFILRLVNP
jgi:hypothetical protein